MRVLSVASELYPLIKTGGLADVAGALPGALAPLGVEMRTLVPGYPAVLAGLERWDEARDRSAEKKRDGAIKDFSKNAAKAYSKLWKETSKIPTDLAEAAREL